MMKKSFRTLGIVLAGALCCPIVALAGNINSAEQGILDAIAGTQEYNGEYYRVTDGYQAKVSAYLSQDDIEMNQREVDNYLAQFYANIGTGIASGYMEKVEQPEGNGEGGGAEDANGGNAGNTSSGNINTGNDKKENTDKDSIGDGSAEQGEAGSGTTGEAGASPAGDAAGSNAGAANAGAGTALGVAPEKDAQGNIIDNTTGSTQSGEIDYTVIPMDGTMYVWDTETLDVHADAYKDSEVIGSIALGDKVSITGGATTGWAEIDYGGKKGYVSAVYLRTDGYMRDQGVDVPDEDAEKAAAEEAAKKAEEEKEKKAQEEAAKKAEEEASQEVEESPEETEEAVKDYSDAKAPEKQINLGMIAGVIIAVLVIACAAVILVHRNKKR